MIVFYRMKFNEGYENYCFDKKCLFIVLSDLEKP